MTKQAIIENSDMFDIYGDNNVNDIYYDEEPSELNIKPLIPTKIDVNLLVSGSLTTLVIDGKKVEFPNQEFVKTTRQIISALNTKIEKLEIQSRLLSTKLAQVNELLVKANRRIDGKIDRA